MELISKDPEKVTENLVHSGILSLVKHLVGLHYDIPRKERRQDMDFSFIEFKFIFEDPQETAVLASSKVDVARLRGGAGRRHAAFAVAKHEKKIGEVINWRTI